MIKKILFIIALSSGNISSALASSVTILANETIFPLFASKLMYSTDGDNFKRLDITDIGQKIPLPPPKDDESMVFEASMKFYGTYRSDSKNAITLTNGDSIAQVIADFRINPPYDGQDSINSLLAPYHTEGILQLENNQKIILFEMGSEDFRDSWYDMQDFVILVEI